MQKNKQQMTIKTKKNMQAKNKNDNTQTPLRT